MPLAARRCDLAVQRFVKDIPIEKNQGVQRLPLGGSGHLAFGCEMGKKPLDILCPEHVRMGLAAEMMDIAEYPLTIGLLGAVSVMMIAKYFAHLIHKLEAGIRAKFRFVFRLTFHNLISQYRNMWKLTRKNAISGQKSDVFSMFRRLI